MPDHSQSTIAAIATPPGPGGIGVIRISGPESLSILKSLFSPKNKRKKIVSHQMNYGWIIDPGTGSIVDEVLVVCMLAPKTYTREDVVEIHCHGSYLLLQDILAMILGCGAQLAAPGEFTKRAFLGGRIDLTRAEAVLDILQAKTPESLRLAMNQLQGKLYEQVMTIRDALVETRAVIEVAIDFPEDDVEILNPDKLARELIEKVKTPLERLISASERGKIFHEGVSVVILGRPNVGKSSLLNTLLREERAIVTPVPGTTRDTIEEYLDIKGIPVQIIDTAGIREAEGVVEEMGIKRSRQKLENADLVLLLIDALQPVSEEDIKLYESAGAKPILLVLNKIDKLNHRNYEDFTNHFPQIPMTAVSAKTHEGLEELEQAVFDLVAGGSLKWDSGHDCVPNIRHKASLAKALVSVETVIRDIPEVTPDLLAVELQTALDHLGDIVGVTDVEDILDTIFERFCIGK